MSVMLIIQMFDMSVMINLKYKPGNKEHISTMFPIKRVSANKR